jgi:hypothetical protein
MRIALLLLSCLTLGACSVVALPFKVVGDVVDVIPVVGGIAAAPFKAVGAAID